MTQPQVSVTKNVDERNENSIFGDVSPKSRTLMTDIVKKYKNINFKVSAAHMITPSHGDVRKSLKSVHHKTLSKIKEFRKTDLQSFNIDEYKKIREAMDYKEQLELFQKYLNSDQGLDSSFNRFKKIYKYDKQKSIDQSGA